MSSKPPIVRQIAWLSVVPQVTVMGVLMAVMHFAGLKQAVLLGALAYLALSIGLRFCVPFAHRRGIALFKKSRYEEAIPQFDRSYDFFTRHKWIDDFRFLTLLSSSRVSYREMALLNTAFCYAQAGNGSKSKEYYERTLVEFPDSEIAKVSLKMIESAEKTAQQTPGGDPSPRTGTGPGAPQE